MVLLYTLAQSISFIFNIVISLLKLVNPFKFFKSVTTTSPYLATNHFTSHLTDIGSGAGNDIADGIATVIASLYGPLYTAGMVILVVMFGFLLASFFLPNMKAKRVLLMKNWLIRGVFIIGGLALLGGTYTTMLDWVDEQTSGSNSAATKVVSSTFFDFEGWVYKGMPLTGVTLDYTLKNSEISASDSIDVQQLCYNLNSKVNYSMTGYSSSLSVTDSNSLVNLISNLQLNRDSNGNFILESATEIADSGEYRWVMSLLERYRLGSKITS